MATNSVPDTDARFPWEARWVGPGGFSSTDLAPHWAELPKEFGKIGGDQHEVGAGLSLYTFVANLHVPVTFHYGFLDPQPYMWLAVGLAGSAAYWNGHKIDGQIAADNSYSAILRDADSVIGYNPGTHCAAGLTVTRDRLEQMLHGQRLNSRLKSFFKGSFDPYVGRFTSTPEGRAIASQIFRHPYEGAAERVFLEAKSYELVAEHLRFLTDDEGGERLLNPGKLASAAREIMMANIAEPASIAEVARQLGVSQRSLSAAFHEAFGASPLHCFTRWRLDLARQLISSGEYSIKQVAHLTGYAYVTNFSQAFIRKFGYPPSHLQK